MKNRLTKSIHKTLYSGTTAYSLGEQYGENASGKWYASVYRKAMPGRDEGGWYLPLALNGNRIGSAYHTWLHHGESMRTTLGKIVFRKEMSEQ